MSVSSGFEQQFDSLADLAGQNFQAARDLIGTLPRAAGGDPVRTAAIIDKGLDVLPDVAARNGRVAQDLIETLARVAGRDPVRTAAFIDKGLDVLPDVAARDGEVVQSLIATLVRRSGLDTTQGLVCREFMLSAKGGSENRTTQIFFASTPEESLAMMGRFQGKIPDLQQVVDARYREEGSDRRHYQQVLATAFDALARRDTLPSFRDVVARSRRMQAAPF